MKRGGRIALVVGGVLLVLLVVVTVLAMVLVTPERVRDFLVPLVKEKTGRTLQLENLEVSLLSGIHIDQVRLVDDQGHPVLGAESAVLRYRFWPLLLGRVMIDRVVITAPHVRLERLADGRLLLPWQTDAGSGKALAGPNAATKVPQPPEQQKSAGAGAAIDLAVRRLLIEDGRVELYDRALDPKTPYLLRLEQLRLAAEDLALDRSFPVELSARFGDANISLQGQVDPAGQRHDISLKTDAIDLAPLLPYLRPVIPGKLSGGHLGGDLELQGDPQSLRLNGTFRIEQLGLALDALPDMPIRDGRIELTFDAAWQAAAKRLELKSARLNYNGLALEATGTADLQGSEGRVQGRARLADVDLRRLPDALPADLAESMRPYDVGGGVELTAELDGALNQPLKALRSITAELRQVRFNYGTSRYGIDGRLAGDLDRLEGKGLKISLGEQSVNLDLALGRLLEAPMTVKGLIRTDRLDMDALLPKEDGTAPSGGAGVAVGKKAKSKSVAQSGENGKAVGNKFAFPVDGTFEVRAGELLSRGVVISDFHALASLKGGILTVDPVKGHLEKGTFVKTLRCDLNRVRPAWQSTVTLEALPVDKLLALAAPDMQGSATGLVNGRLSLNGRGLTEDQIRTSLGGEGNIELKQAVISGTKLSRGLVGLLGMGQLNEIDIEQGVLKLKIKNGLASLDGVFAGQDLRLEPAGAVDLRGPVKISLPLWLAPRLAGGLALKGFAGSLLKNDAGWTLVPLKVAGRIEDPSVSLDDKALKRRTRQKVKETLKKKLLEKIAPEGTGAPVSPEKQLLQDALKNLLGQ